MDSPRFWFPSKAMMTPSTLQKLKCESLAQLSLHPNLGNE